MSEQTAHLRNRLLASLSQADMEMLLPHLRVAPLTHRTILFSAGEPISRVYFPHTGIISLVVELSDGQEVEIAMIGLDTVAGGSAALNGKTATNRAVVQIPGACSWISVNQLKNLAEKSRSLGAVLWRHQRALMVQAQQSAACNATHTIDQRLARWLLRCRDLMESRELHLTQEFLGTMLGVRRTSVTLAAKTLQDAGIIAYHRGVITILSESGLQAEACECYGAVIKMQKKLGIPEHEKGA
jgi:CRP-like cAMP-binding protein